MVDHLNQTSALRKILLLKQSWVFRGKSAGDSDRIRPPIPIQVGHLFRLNPATP
jgi:hypothetical protein